MGTRKEGPAARAGADAPRRPANDGEEKRAGITRREVVLGVGGTVALFGIGAASKAFAGEAVLRPPGGQDEDDLLSKCLRCQKCTEACPRDAIVPVGLEGGFLSMRTPTMDYHAGDCDYCADENGERPLCVAACPTGALKLSAIATRRSTVIGEPLLVKDWCLAYRLTHCRDCYNACPLDAIELDDAERPHIVWDNCNGCGECEHACKSMTAGTPVPGATHRAIIIVPVGQGGEVNA
ncbi:MAG: 4Fe-4S dicluster domain-containing protein [Coriobacteriales bacterium]|jgi:ferredoxin-type protein NapG